MLDLMLVADRSADPEVYHCDACRSWFERARRQAHVMAELSRPTFDSASLEGLVVAELNAGRRQERAAAAFASLERLAAPADLDDLVRDRLFGAPSTAPEELERRVALDLALGPGPRVGRQLSNLDRLDVPSELDERVARSLANLGRSDVRPMRRWIAIAAGLFVVLGAAAIAWKAGSRQVKRYEFAVVHVDSVNQLDPFARNLLSVVSGGIADLPGEAR